VFFFFSLFPKNLKIDYLNYRLPQNHRPFLEWCIWLIRSARVGLHNLNFPYATFSDYYALLKISVFFPLINSEFCSTTFSWPSQFVKNILTLLFHTHIHTFHYKKNFPLLLLALGFFFYYVFLRKERSFHEPNIDGTRYRSWISLSILYRQRGAAI
jgi:hypothetical protein